MAIEVLRAGVGNHDTTVKMLVVGESGAGKTRTASCWPDPLILDLEGGVMSVADRETPNVRITKSLEITEILNLFQQKRSIFEKTLGVPVRTLVVDTVDELARLLVRERLLSERKEAMAIQDWGWLGDQLRIYIRALRNLPDMNVILNVHAKTQEDSETGRTFVKPGIQGAMGDEIAGYVDIAVLLKARPVATVVNGKNVRVIQRVMQTYPDSMHGWVKDRSGKLPQEFPVNFNDDFERLDGFLFGEARAREVADFKAIQAELQAKPEPVVASESTPEPTPEPVAPEPEERIIATPEAEVAPLPEFDLVETLMEEPEPEVESEPEPEPEIVPDAKPVAKKAAPKKKAATPAPATPNPREVVEQIVAAGSVEEEVPVAVTGVKNPEGTYDESSTAVAADCPKGFGCTIDKDMADLSYIRFRKRLCRSCFVEAKKQK